MEVHQQHHGYLRGHQLLASSIKLDRVDQDLIDRLSDIAGSIQGGSDVPEYLTGYPLPSGKFFVFARTWYDDEAQRAGCVLTHSLFVPLVSWAENITPSSLRNLHRRFPHADMSPLLPLDWDEDSLDDDLPAEIENASSELVEALFLEKNAPVLWVANDANNAVIRVVDALWPSLRRRFAFQTYALKPRYLADRPFDLVVTPRSARNRFGDWPGRRVEGSGSPRHPWTLQLSREIFQNPQPSLARVDPLGILTSESTGDQSNLRMSLHWNDLNQRADNPTVSLGMLDILSASPVPEERAVVLVEGIVERMLLHRLWRDFPGGAGKFIGLLVSKLEDLPSSPKLSEPLHNAARHIFIEDPDSAREFLLGAKPTNSRYNGLLTRSFLDAAGAANSPQFAEIWLMLEDERFTDFLSSQPHLLEVALRDPNTRHRLVDRIQRSFSLFPHLVQDRVRHLVVRGIEPETIALIPLLLADFEGRDLRETIEHLLSADEAVRPAVLAALLNTRWSPTQEAVLRTSVGASKLPAEEKGRIFARLLNPTREELLWLVDLSSDVIGATFAAADWKVDKIAVGIDRDSDLGRRIIRELFAQEKASEAVRLLSRIRIPLDEKLSLLGDIVGQADQGALQELLDDMIRSAFPIRTAKDARVAQKIMTSPDALKAFSTLRPNEVADLLFPEWDASASEIEAGLEFLVSLPDDAQRILTSSSDKIVKRVSEFSSSKINKRILVSWAHWIGKLGIIGTKSVQDAADRSLHFALTHTRKPVSELVLASMPITYPILKASGRMVQRSFFGPSIGQATAMAHEVADAFYYSDLPPRDLAVLAVRLAATDEIFARLENKWGGHTYLRRMFKDLNPKRSGEEKQARKHLRAYLID